MLMDNKKKKILIGAGIGTFILVTLFAFLIFNHDKAPTNASKLNSSKKSETTTANAHNESEKKDSSQKNNSNSTFKEVMFNGNQAKVEPGDISISEDGKVLISSDLLSKTLNEPVSWKDGIIYIGKQPVNDQNKLGTYITDLDYLKFYAENNEDTIDKSKIYKNAWEDSTPFSIAGTQFQKGLGWDLSYPQMGFKFLPVAYYLDFNLAGKYKKFKAEVGVDDQFRDTVANYIVKIYGDERLLATTKAFKGGDFALPVEVDVSNVIRLKLEVNRVDDGSGSGEETGKVVIGNAILE